MSYCRKDGLSSDVYVIPTGDGKGVMGWECLSCNLAPEGKRWYFCYTRQEILKHLEQHRISGDRVPEYATDRLKREILEEST